MKLLVLFVLLGFSTEALAVEGSWDIPDYDNHPCQRPCQDDALPRVCEYTFIVEDYVVLSKACYNCPANLSDCFRPHCVPGDGQSRGIKTVNRKLPGPGIQVCEGDTVKVTVINRMDVGEGTSIHWHGILQHRNGHMDGVGLVTQCPISARSAFTYTFAAENAGTHYWHAHSGLQRADGLFGPLVVRRPPKFEPHKDLYDHDLAEHVITVTDWLSDYTLNKFAQHHHSDGDNKAESMLINGMGEYRAHVDAEGKSHMTPRATFTVTPGHRYRFRVISSAIVNCPIQISIDNHNLTMIASDGNSFEPFLVESFFIFAGERFDFVLHTSPSMIGNYWIRARGIADCGVKHATQSAILRYEGAPDTLPAGGTTWEDGIRAGKLLNPWNQRGTDDAVEVEHMRATDPDDDWMTSVPDRKFFMAMDFNEMDNQRFNPPDLYAFHSVSPLDRLYSPQINHISSVLPSAPLLSQYEETPQHMYCNAETVQKHCDVEWCECIHRYQVGLNDLVELIVLDEGKPFKANHPMHLHGHKFRVVGIDRLGEQTSIEEIRALDAQGQLPRVQSRAPFKDTVTVPDGGYTIMRFRATNPGVWFFHCHIQFHHQIGMGLIIQVGEPHEFPPTPKGFPTCGNFHGDPSLDVPRGDKDAMCPAAGSGRGASLCASWVLALCAVVCWLASLNR